MITPTSPSTAANPALKVGDVLREEYLVVHGALPKAITDAIASGDTADIERRLQRANFDQKTTALCLSGGGIRSASFCLGATQGLAKLGILGKFDYFSTVSGGGYLGSMLAAWAYRAPGGMADVEVGLTAPPTAANVGWLREYLRYLSPRRGLFGPDTWTLMSTYVRNFILNALIWFPMLAGLLTLPYLVVALVDAVAGRWKGTPTLDSVAAWSLLLGLGLFGLAIILMRFVVGRIDRDPTLPIFSLSSFANARRLLQLTVELIGPNNIIVQVLLMAGILAATCGTYWSGYEVPFPLWANMGDLLHGFMPESWWSRVAADRVIQIALVFGLLNALAAATYDPVAPSDFWFTAIAVVAGIVTGLVTGAAIGVIVTQLSASGQWPLSAPLFMTLVPPAMVASVGLGEILFIGATSKWSSDFDREWWSRAGAWSSMLAFGWLALFSLAFLAPLAMDRLRSALDTEHAWRIYWPVVGGLAAILARVLFLQPPSSSATAVPNRLRTDRVLDAVTLLAVIAILVGISDFVSSSLRTIAAWPPLDPYRMPHASAMYAPVDVLALLLPLLIVLGLASCCVSVNRFSLHAMYRDRLIRTFLGASRADYPDPPWSLDERWREPRQFRARSPNSFIQFDRDDNPILRWLAPKREPRSSLQAAQSASRSARPAMLQPGAVPELVVPAAPVERRAPARAPFLLVNAALNLVAGRNLAWQERKAASFTFSALHVGSGEPEVGYRSSKEYASRVGGITLGTAMAVSGAAISPNAGAFSTPLRTFLLTLFNARLGWWLGHPDEPKAVAASGPRFAAKPMLRELLGRTDDRKPWLFVSDGGHFDNLGLYEMVRRGCTSIIVIDAGCDPERKFDDIGNAIRKIRIDLGIAVRRKGPWGFGPRDAEDGGYAAWFEVDYDATRKGTLLYIKPAFYQRDVELPIDVLQYAGRSATFPHESTSDQFFSESQFESYRALGEFEIGKIIRSPTPLARIEDAIDLASSTYIF